MRPGEVFGDRRACLDCRLHRFDRHFGISVQLPRVGDAGKRGEVRLAAYHLLQRFEGAGVVSKLNLGVGHHAIEAGAFVVAGERLLAQL